jgi:hypothetical protein
MKDLDFTNVSDPHVVTNFQIVRDEIVSLENTRAVITKGNGAPAAGNEADLHIDYQNNRLYANVNGTWKYTALT